MFIKSRSCKLRQPDAPIQFIRIFSWNETVQKTDFVTVVLRVDKKAGHCKSKDIAGQLLSKINVAYFEVIRIFCFARSCSPYSETPDRCFRSLSNFPGAYGRFLKAHFSLPQRDSPSLRQVLQDILLI